MKLLHGFKSGHGFGCKELYYADASHGGRSDRSR